MTPTPTQRNAAIVAGTAAAALLVLGAFFGPAPADDSAGRAARSPAPTSSTTRAPGTATTRPAATTTTSSTMPLPARTLPPNPSPAAPSASAPPSGGSTGSPGVAPPPTRPPPEGVVAESEPDACTWDAADGGTLRASGMISNAGNGEDTWLVSVDWNDDIGFLDNESDYFVVAPGASTPWSLTVTGADAPTGALTCTVEVG